MMLDQPPTGVSNSLPAAERGPAAGDPVTIGDDVFCLGESRNVVDQNFPAFLTALQIYEMLGDYSLMNHSGWDRLGWSQARKRSID